MGIPNYDKGKLFVIPDATGGRLKTGRRVAVMGDGGRAGSGKDFLADADTGNDGFDGRIRLKGSPVSGRLHIKGRRWRQRRVLPMTPVTTRVRDISVCPPTDTSTPFAFSRAENQASNYELTWPLLFPALAHVSAVLFHPPTVSQLAPGRVATAAVRVGTMGPVDGVVVSGGRAVGGGRVRAVR